MSLNETEESMLDATVVQKSMIKYHLKHCIGILDFYFSNKLPQKQGNTAKVSSSIKQAMNKVALEYAPAELKAGDYKLLGIREFDKEFPAYVVYQLHTLLHPEQNQYAFLVFSKLNIVNCTREVSAEPVTLETFSDIAPQLQAYAQKCMHTVLSPEVNGEWARFSEGLNLSAYSTSSSDSSFSSSEGTPSP